ncbi:hypothetical protein K504DRAFT_287257 [Pleomassaria siparia CBS 279.74]|uniref:F-box domain-containing protein n=1 Tax=Pleomassaria siparia CBS 279.74 TaxID=1314801 RepID=A0A6G1K7A2_9PLEO|nr:hypothetical protein K504DRAFT_287257 [Pleomassaria siparia CBS 279.74]
MIGTFHHFGSFLPHIIVFRHQVPPKLFPLCQTQTMRPLPSLRRKSCIPLGRIITLVFRFFSNTFVVTMPDIIFLKWKAFASGLEHSIIDLLPVSARTKIPFCFGNDPRDEVENDHNGAVGNNELLKIAPLPPIVHTKIPFCFGNDPRDEVENDHNGAVGNNELLKIAPLLPIVHTKIPLQFGTETADDNPTDHRLMDSTETVDNNPIEHRLTDPTRGAENRIRRVHEGPFGVFFGHIKTNWDNQWLYIGTRTSRISFGHDFPLESSYINDICSLDVVIRRHLLVFTSMTTARSVTPAFLVQLSLACPNLTTVRFRGTRSIDGHAFRAFFVFCPHIRTLEICYNDVWNQVGDEELLESVVGALDGLREHAHWAPDLNYLGLYKESYLPFSRAIYNLVLVRVKLRVYPRNDRGVLFPMLHDVHR